MAQANGSTNGYLSSADWTTFNGKQASGSYLTELTGDVTAAGPGSAAATLAAVVLAGTSTKVTYDVKGRVTSGTSLIAADIPPLSAAVITSGALAVANGGTGLGTTPSNGQLLIGNGANYALGNLTAGTGINISNSAGAITVSATADASTKVSKTGDTLSGALNLPANGLVAGTNQLVLANGNVGIGTTVPAVSIDLRSRTDAIALPSGTSAQQPASPVAGWIRYNTTTSALEYYNGTIWAAASNAVDPAGMIGAYPMATCPTGWLQANGAAVSRTTYASLFTAIGTMYGSGDGSTTFNLPDYRGYFLRGWNNGTAIDPDAASRTNRGDGTTGDNIGTKQSYATGPLANGSVILYGTTNYASYTTGGGNAGPVVQLSNGYNPRESDNETRPKNVNVIYCVSTAMIGTVTTANTGSGSANYIPQWTSTTALGNSPVAVSGSNVGIGSTAPTQALDVGGKVASTNLRQMVSATNEVTTTSTTAVDIPSMSMTINGSGLPVTMIANLSGIYFAAASYALYISLVVDGSQASLCVISAAAAGNKNSCSLTAMQTLSAGSHTIKLQWYLQSAGTAGVSWGFANRSILVFE
jgi:microcystin-dependent protein